MRKHIIFLISSILISFALLFMGLSGLVGHIEKLKKKDGIKIVMLHAPKLNPEKNEGKKSEKDIIKKTEKEKSRPNEGKIVAKTSDNKGGKPIDNQLPKGNQNVPKSNLQNAKRRMDQPSSPLRGKKVSFTEVGGRQKYDQYLSNGKILTEKGQKFPAVSLEYQNSALLDYISFLKAYNCTFWLRSASGHLLARYDPCPPGKILPLPQDYPFYNFQFRNLGEFGVSRQINRIINEIIENLDSLDYGYGCRLLTAWSKQFEFLMLGAIQKAADNLDIPFQDIDGVKAHYLNKTIFLNEIITSHGTQKIQFKI